MIKKTVFITLFLALSLFLVMPVSAGEPGSYIKTTDVYPGDLDYRNSLVDWHGFNLDFNVFWTKQSGMPPDLARLYVYENSTLLYNLQTWVYDADIDMYKLTITAAARAKILSIIFSRTINTTTNIYFNARTTDTDAFIFETKIEFRSLLNINLGTFYVADSLYQSQSGVLSSFQNSIDIIGIENAIGGGKAEFTIARLFISDHTTRPIGTGSIVDGREFASYAFINKYTGVHGINFNMVMSANSFDPATAALNYYIYQLGFFADTQVILPDLDIDTDFQIYEPAICGSLDFACISRNLIGEFSNNIYLQLGADNLALGVMGIYDTLFKPVYIIDDIGWQNAIISIYAILTIGVLYLIVKRVLS